MKRIIALAVLGSALSNITACGNKGTIPETTRPTTTAKAVESSPSEASSEGPSESAQPPQEESSEAAAQPELAALKLATWNLEWFNARDDTGTVKRTAADYSRLKGYADRLNADIIAVQEVDGPDALQRVFDPAVYAVHVSSRQNVQRTGFAYRNTLKVTKNPDYEALDVGSVRDGTDLTVELDSGKKLRLLSVHLKSGCFDKALSDSGNACTKRLRSTPSPAPPRPFGRS